MIRINLLPVKKTKKRGAGQQQLLLMVFVLIGLSLLLYYFKMGEDDEIAVLMKKEKSIKAEMSRLEELIGDINTFQKKKDDLQKKLDIIEMLKKNKTGPVRILDELSTVIPKKVWLTSLVEGQNKLDMAGYSTDNKEIAVFMKNLEASKYFSKVKLLSIKQSTIANTGAPVMLFSLNCTYSLPQS